MLSKLLKKIQFMDYEHLSKLHRHTFESSMIESKFNF